ncbi:hypothetical protein LPU83_2535 [Rhizobium favelukesii]|uniref:Uncharacterized protein n=1 Tax=Rhizobium favelukesii TaxID=348824 RepID=W6RBH0_9HYPH|nr:hypothetical protein LPU83_2535 [Rhizobium favelukesii]
MEERVKEYAPAQALEFLFLHLPGRTVHIPATSKWIDDALQE